MLKFLFWILLLANGVAFAAWRGYLGDSAVREREPARLANQLNADKIRIVPASVATAPPAKPAAPEPAEAPAETVAAAARPAPVCLEVGPLPLADARRFEAMLAPLALGKRLDRVPLNEANGYIVHIPPLGSKEAADRKAGELRALGVESFFVIQDASPLRWAISLGVFKTEAAAQNHLAALNKQGVRTARVAPRLPANARMSFQLRELDAAQRARVERIRLNFPASETRLCR